MPDVVLPVLDEAAAIPGVLAAMPAGYRPIVVDNGSADGSAEIAANLGAQVVEEPRRGFGAACFAGLEAAAAEVVCFMDCDGSLDPADLPRVVALLDLDLRDRRSGWPLEMVVKAVTAGWSIADTPVPYAERQGRSKVTGTVRGTLQAIGDMSAILRVSEKPVG